MPDWRKGVTFDTTMGEKPSTFLRLCKIDSLRFAISSWRRGDNRRFVIVFATSQRKKRRRDKNLF